VTAFLPAPLLRPPGDLDLYASWVLLQRRSDGAVVSVVAVHHMTNGHRHKITGWSAREQEREHLPQ